MALEGLDKSGNIVETVNLETKDAKGTLSDMQYTVGSSTITRTYTGDTSKARLVVNGNIIFVSGTFKDGTFSYYLAPETIRECSTVMMEANGKGDILLTKNFPVLI